MKHSLLIASACVLAGTFATPASAFEDVCHPNLPGYLQQKLIAKAAQGTGDLRRFVQSTKPIYNLDVQQVADWLEARAQCQGAMAAAPVKHRRA